MKMLWSVSIRDKDRGMTSEVTYSVVAMTIEQAIIKAVAHDKATSDWPRKRGAVQSVWFVDDEPLL